jgi:hypothetical protein
MEPGVEQLKLQEAFVVIGDGHSDCRDRNKKARCAVLMQWPTACSVAPLLTPLDTALGPNPTPLSLCDSHKASDVAPTSEGSLT